MEKYSARLCPDVPEPEPAPNSIDLGQLALDYSLSDMMDFSSGDPPCDEPTVDDKFNAYTRVTFKNTVIPDQDILVFWEVSIRTMHYHSRLGFMLHRNMKPSSPHYTQLHLTIYLSRGQQFHVNVFSLRVWRQTQSGAIEFSLSSWRPCKFLSSL